MPSSQSMRKEAWLCLRFTHLALNSVGVESGSAEQAQVVTEQERIWQHDKGASAYAIKNGMSLNQALMLHPQLIMHQRQPAVEEQKLLALAHWAYRFTATVSIYNDHSLLLEVGKSMRLFGGLSALLSLIASDLGDFSIDTRYGVGHTPKAALLLSFSEIDFADIGQLSNNQEQLGRVDISNLAVSEAIIEQLEACGFNCLADIADIPNADLGNRFGIDFLDYLDKLFGRSADLQTTITPPETFSANRDFAEPISNVTWIKQQLEHLLSDLVQFIQQRQLVCRGFIWKLFDEKNQLLATIAIALNTQHYTKKALLKSMLELTELKFNRLSLTWSFSRIELLSQDMVQKQLFNNDLFDPKPDEEAFNQLIDKLVNRFGAKAVFQVFTNPELLPELANVREATVDSKGQGYRSSSMHFVSEFKDQPLWLLNPPKPIPQQSKQPVFEGALQLIHGPDRVVSHWWTTLQSRDYYIARQTSGRLLWLFFDRAQQRWFLHGLFG